jgi:energy-coupling factor transporter ATP-binding protein EcfA2
MRIRSISVTKLFGIFDHEIPLNMKERITIIHGLNGYGKTAILRMLRGLLSGDNEPLVAVPFATFKVRFADGSELRVEKKSSTPREHILILYRRENEPDALIELVRQGPSFYWEPRDIAPEPLRALHKSMNVQLIETQRLSVQENAYETALVVEKYAKDLAARIGVTLTDYAARSQELDRTFPVRLLQQTEVVPLPVEDLRSKLGELEQRRTRLATLGFLEPEGNLTDVPQTIEPSKLSVLTIYVSDMEEKLRGFDDLAARIELFTMILNDRFSYKRVSVHRDHGFIFTGANGAPLPLPALSSGEQHEIVLLYELLFLVKPDSLILIDEPEISLHVTWQQEFVNDLEKVVKLSGVDVLLATHSPEIIGEHWDWTVALKGPAT